MGNTKQLRWLPLARTALLLALVTPLLAHATASCLTETFDEVTAPALPVGWTSTVAYTANATTTAAGTLASVYTAGGPNVFWFDDYKDSVDTSLYSPVFAVGLLGSPSINFQHSYSLWAGNPAGVTAPGASAYTGVYNGAALEVSINGGNYVDFVAAGGSLTNGYTANLDPNFNNPISPNASRSVWGGDSGGFVNVVATVPASALGGTVQFRWRLGTAGGGRGFVTHSGWWIDSVEYESLGDEIFHDDYEGGTPCAH